MLALAEAELMPEISSEWIDAARTRHATAVVSLLERLATRAEFQDDLEAARQPELNRSSQHRFPVSEP